MPVSATAAEGQYDPSGHLQEQVRRLEAQVSFFRQLAVQNNHVLADVRALLAEERGAEVAAISRRVSHLMDRQAAAVRGEDAGAAGRGEQPRPPMLFDPARRDDDGDSAAASDDGGDGGPPGGGLRSTQRPHSARIGGNDGPVLFDGGEPLAGRAGKSASDETIADAARDTSERLLSATTRLADAWLTSKRRAVDRLLDAPTAAFEAFHEAPTEEALEGFLAAYRDATAAVRAELDPAAATAGSPFKEERVAELYRSAVSSALHAVRDDAVVATSRELKQQRDVRPTLSESAPRTGRAVAPVAAASPDASSSSQQPRRVPLRAVGASGVPPQQQQQQPSPCEAATPAPGRGRADPPTLSAHAMGAATPSASSAQPTPRAATPSRYSRASQDSSQMRNAIFGDASATPAGTPARRAPGGPPESAEVQMLRRQLAQLELQMGLITGRQGDTGSEAKFYALTRKVQRVRAELIAKQREEEEVAAVRAAVEEQRHRRDADRRAFGR